MAEAHDAFFQAQAARRAKVFGCLVPGCAKAFRSGHERAQHLHAVHFYEHGCVHALNCSVQCIRECPALEAMPGAAALPGCALLCSQPTTDSMQPERIQV